MWVRLKAALAEGDPPRTHGGIVGQVWRGSARQARLSGALAGLEVVPIDDEAGRSAGRLLASTQTSDVIDAALVLLAHDGDHLITSDPDDLAILATASGRHVEIVRP